MKNLNTALPKGYEAGKKVSDIKYHIVVDVLGFAHATAVITAEVTDRKGALETLGRYKPSLNRVQHLLADECYVGEPFSQAVREVLGRNVTVQIAKRSELHSLKVMPKRWIVERSFA